MNKFVRWLEQLVEDNWPRWCVSCSRVIRNREARFERTSTGARVPLCPNCHTAIFHPFSVRLK